MRSTVRRISDLLDPPVRRALLVGVVISAIIALSDTFAIALVLPLIDLATNGQSRSPVTAWLVDRIQVGEPASLVMPLTVAVILLFVIKDLGSLAFNWWLSGVISRERARVSALLLRSFLTMPFTQMSRRSSAELLRTMNESVFQVFSGVVSGLLQAVVGGLSLLALLVALLVVSPIETLAIALLFGVAVTAYLAWLKPRANRAGQELNRSAMTSYRTALAAIGGIKEVTIRGAHDVFVSRYRREAMRMAHASRWTGFVAGLPRYALEILFILALGCVLIVNNARSGGSNMGSIAVLTAAGFRALPSVTALLGCVSAIRISMPALDIVHRDFTAPHVDPAPVREDRDLTLADRIVMDGVTFTYPGASGPAVIDASLTQPVRGSTALVGGSGAGKTTVVDLFLGLHRPTSGRILVDGKNIADHADGWRAKVGYVPQDVFILDATLAENVAFDESREQIDIERLHAALASAQLDDVVAQLPLGIDTEVGERGTRLSGGQRQRLGIARALYRQPSFLVLDEATSALDNETERRITEVIENLSDHLTVLVVAHRLSTVRRVDQIAFMADGRIVDVGSFEEVRQRNAEFARLVQLGTLVPDGETTSE